MKRYYILFIVFLSANLFSQKTNFDNSNNNIESNFENIQNLKIVFPFANNSSYIRDVVLSNDNKYVATCIDGLVLISEASSGKTIYRVKGDRITFSPNNKYFVVASSSGVYQLYDFKTGEPLFDEWNSGGIFPHTLVFSPRSNQVLTNSPKGIVVNTIGENKITHKTFKIAKIIWDHNQFRGCNFDTTGAVIIIPNYNTLNFYNSQNFKLEKKLYLGGEYEDISSVLNLGSSLYVVGQAYNSDRIGSERYTVFMKYILDEKRNIISNQTILEGTDWEGLGQPENFLKNYLTQIKLIKDKISLFKCYKYYTGIQYLSNNIVSFYSLEKDSFLFDLKPENNFELIEDVSTDLSFSVISHNYESFSRKIIHYNINESNNNDGISLKNNNIGKINYLKENEELNNRLLVNSSVNLSYKDRSFLSFDFESSPKIINLQDIDSIEYQYTNNYNNIDPYLAIEKEDSTFIFDEFGLLKYKMKGEIIAHDIKHNKSVFYSSDNEIQIYDISKNSIIKTIKSPVQPIEGFYITSSASINYEKNKLAITFDFRKHSFEDLKQLRTVYIYNIDSGRLLKEIKFDTCDATIYFDQSGEKICLNKLYYSNGGYEVRNIETDSTICKSDISFDQFVFLNDNNVFYTHGFESWEKYLFIFGKSDNCLDFKNEKKTISKSLSFKPLGSSAGGGIKYNFSDSLNTILLSNIDNKIYKINNNLTNYNMKSVLGNLEQINMPAFIQRANYIKNNKYILAIDNFDHYHIINAETNKTLYTFLFLPNHNWLVYDEFYRFDGSKDAINSIYFTCGLEIIELNQVKDSLYVPNLVQRIMNGENINHLPKLNDLQICGVTPLVEPIDEKRYKYQITPRTGGIGDIDIYINGIIRQSISSKQLKKEGNTFLLNIDSTLIKKYSNNNGENLIKVIAKTANNGISSRSYTQEVESVKNNELKQPSVHAIMIGIDDYKGNELDLNYAAKDANDIQKALQLATKKYFNTNDINRVNFYNLTIDRNSKIGTGNIKSTTPDRNAIFNTLQLIEKNSKPEDIFILFFAGHGEIVDKDQLLLLTTESSKDNFQGIRMSELLEKVNKIPAGKRILILDACHSGAAINNMDLAQFVGKRDVKDAELKSQRLKELDKLASKSGFAIITASSSDQKALELPQYEHGLLTYALLNAMLNNKNSLDENNQLQLNKWLLATEEEMKKLTNDQSAESMVPISFTLGKIDEEVRKTITLKEIPTVYIDAVLNKTSFKDNLNIKSLLSNAFQESSRGGENKIMIADYPNAIKANILYEVKTSGQVKANVVLFKQNFEVNFEVIGKTDQINKFVEELMAQIRIKIQK